jgi:UDP-3-O-[3-hydroxymyristoyl] glucosamine N-acyltransferase
LSADPRFHPAGRRRSLAELAEAIGAEARGDGARMLSGVGALDTAGPEEVAFLEHRRWLPLLAGTRAGAVVLDARFADRLPEGSAALLTASPQLGFARIAALLHPTPAPRPGVHPSAAVAETARLGPGCEVGPFAVIGDAAEVGEGCVIGPHAVVGAGVVLGPRCRIGAHASVTHCLAGEGVVLHPGARVGQDGFGFVPTPEGRYQSVPQLGRVILGDFVDIGANACVDRGALGDTVLGPGTRLDNMVQIGHNVRAGRGCVFVAHAAIAGSVTLGDYVQVAGQAAIAGHLTIGDRVRIGAQSGVMNDLPAGTDVVGSPAWPAKETFRAMAMLKRLASRRDGKQEG